MSDNDIEHQVLRHHISELEETLNTHLEASEIAVSELRGIIKGLYRRESKKVLEEKIRDVIDILR